MSPVYTDGAATNDYENAIADADASGLQKDSADQIMQRQLLKSRYLEKFRSAVSTTKGLTSKDLEEAKASFTESKFEQYGAKTHEEKVEWLEENIDTWLPATIADVKEKERVFNAAVDTARQKGWISSQSANRWKDRLAKDDASWYKKKLFITNKFPGYYKNWERLHKDVTKAKNKAKELGLDRGKMVRLAPLLDHNFLDEPYEVRKMITDNALAALAAYEKKREDLYGLAQDSLLQAVSDGVLAANKVSEWMRRIFESNASDELIEAFLTNRGNMPLKELVRRWTSVKDRYDKVEQKREQGFVASGFNFVHSHKFLNMHYAQRLAYVEEAERRMNTSNRAPGVFWDIRRELDTKDWESAQDLIDQAKKMELSEKHQKELNSMQRYLTTHRQEHPQIAEEVSEDDPQADMYAALSELHNISPSTYKMYKNAIARGLPTFSALASLMYNRCWCHERNVLDEDKEEVLRESAEEETKDVMLHGHDPKKGENMKVPGYGNPAIRRYNGEWKYQVLHVSDDPGSHNAIVDQCQAQSGNHAFKYWSTLVPDNLSIEKHKYIVYNLNWRIKSGMRKGGGKAQNVSLARKPGKTKKAETPMALHP